MSDVLQQANVVRREVFNPKLKRHVDSLKAFLSTGSWGDVKFYPELPYIEVPMSVMVKYLRYSLKVDVETAAAMAERMAAKNVVTETPAPTKEERAAALAYSNELMKALKDAK
jgi:hypothetical protein